jgi:hypothetical protein
MTGHIVAIEMVIGQTQHLIRELMCAERLANLVSYDEREE